MWFPFPAIITGFNSHVKSYGGALGASRRTWSKVTRNRAALVCCVHRLSSLLSEIWSGKQHFGCASAA
jgi:hypothetical protein